MRQIDKRSKERLSQATQSFTELREKATQIINECNAKLADLGEAVEDARQDAYGVLDDLCNEAQTYYDNRSEAWRDKDSGENYLNWINDLEEVRDTLDGELQLFVDSEMMQDLSFVIDALNQNVPESPDE